MDDEHTHWIAGRIVDGEPRSAGSPWLWLLCVAVLVLAVDLTLGLGRAEHAASPIASDDADVRAQLLEVAEATDAGRPAFVLVGDSVLAGDVMAASVPDWASQRVVDHMRAELGSDSDAVFGQIAFDGLLPIDALHVLAELDRIDPAAEITFVLELDLRYFSSHYAAQDTCTRAALCELGRVQLDAETGGTFDVATAGLVEAADLVHEWLRRRAPIARHRPQLRRPTLAELDGLAVARAGSTSEPIERTEGLARVSAHYREAELDNHAQVAALVQIVDRLRARGRSAALFLTPLDDEFVRSTLPGNRLGNRYELLARLIHDRGGPEIMLLALDHPLFDRKLFLDHVHLDPEGNRILALNLLHELGLPLRNRPFDWMLVHVEDHDRSLVHRRGVGYADGGATRALFRAPEGVAVNATGDWIVIADTGNHMLRQLRGSMQIVERLAGSREPGARDGPATLEQPRSPEIVGDAVVFIDGPERERIRKLARGAVTTLSWTGPRCPHHDALEAEGTTLYVLCSNDRVLAIDLDTRVASIAFDPRAAQKRVIGVVGIEPTNDGRLLLADADSRIWSITLDSGESLPDLLFANDGVELLPRGAYPFGFAEMRLNRILAMEWVDRYGALLVQDAHELGTPHKRLQREQTERVHLRLLDLDNQRIYPWIKATPHAEASHMWNAVTNNLVSYTHLGAMAVVESDASLVYVERTRSRVFRIADGLLAAAKTGSLQSDAAKIELLNPIDVGTAAEISATFRPDRFLSTRHEPIPRAGPYVALVVGSSHSTLSDRLGNYSLGRLLELELGSELGYRDATRLDVYLRTHPSATLATGVDTFEGFLSGEGPPPDIVLFELHGAPEPDAAALDRIEALADRYNSLIVFYDNSAMLADGRDGLRATTPALARLIADIRARGFVVVEPSDRLLRELSVESPWGSQPWGPGRDHGSPWAIELTSDVISSSVYPQVREFLRGRTPARVRHELRAEGPT
jgi:hypothetical protein